MVLLCSIVVPQVVALLLTASWHFRQTRAFRSQGWHGFRLWLGVYGSRPCGVGRLIVFTPGLFSRSGQALGVPHGRSTLPRAVPKYNLFLGNVTRLIPCLLDRLP